MAITAQAREAELAVIGTILLDPEKVLPVAIASITADDFAQAEYGHLFDCCKGLYLANEPVDVVTVLARAGGEYKPLIVNAVNTTPTINGYEAYIQIVAEEAKRRRGLEKALEVGAALQGGDDLETCQALAEELTAGLTSTVGDTEVTAAEGIYRFFETKQAPKTYIPTGFGKLDKKAYLDRGDYVVVGGRPSAGKTALTLQIALHMARKYRVVYFSLETSADKIYDRLIANYTGTPLAEIKEPQTIKDWGRIAESTDSFGKLNLTVVEAAGWTVGQLRAKAMQLRAEVVFIDYLSLLQSPGNSRYEKVSNISIDLHTMAQKQKLLVVALSQLNRGGDGQEPSLTDLRESGQIEQDADVVLLLHSQDEDDQEADRGLIIAKNKEGAVGKMLLRFDGALQRFAEVINR